MLTARFGARQTVGVAVGAFLAVAGGSNAWAVTTTEEFDAFPLGTSLSTQVAGVTFPDGPVVAGSLHTTTFSAPNHLRSRDACLSNVPGQCPSNTTSRMRMQFPTGVSGLSLRVGLDDQAAIDEAPAAAQLVAYDAAGLVVRASPAMTIANVDSYGPITTQLTVADVSARIRSATLFVGLEVGAASFAPYRAEIDDLQITTPDGPPPPPQDPPVGPPSVTITDPDAGTIFTTPQISIEGMTDAPDGVLGFCASVNDDTTLPSTCNEASRVIADAGSAGHFNLPVTLNAAPGPQSVTVWIQDRDGRVAHATVSVVLGSTAAGVGAGVDLRQRGMDVLQATQVPEHPRPTGPPFTSPGSIFLRAPSERYDGVTLIAGATTVVRVYADAVAAHGSGPVRAAHVTAGLFGYRRSAADGTITRLPPPGPPGNQGPLAPDFGARTLTPTSANLHGDPGSAYTFTLPIAWTRLGADELILAAYVNPEIVTVGRGGECSGCGADNQLALTGIRFRDVRTAFVTPIQATYVRDGRLHSVTQQQAYNSFSLTQATMPFGDHQLIEYPYYGTVDVTPAVRCNDDDFRLRLCRRNRPLPAVQDPDDLLRADGIAAAVRAYATAGDRPGTAGIPVAELDDGAYIRGEFDGSRYLVDTIDRSISLPHELGHAFGLPHASPGCGGGADGQVAADWPPDEVGLLQGYGLDRRPRSGGLDGPYGMHVPGSTPALAIYDFMSYCGGEVRRWISPRNWTAITRGVSVNGTLRDSQMGRCIPYPYPNTLVTLHDDGTQTESPLCQDAAGRPFIDGNKATLEPADSRRSRVRQVPGPTLRIGATVARGLATGTLGAITAGGPAVTPTDALAVVHVVIRDAAGAVVSDTGVVPKPGGDTGDASIDVTVPAAGAARVELVAGPTVLATATRSAHAPTVTLRGLPTGTKVDSAKPLTVRWAARDADGDPLAATVLYAADGTHFSAVLSGTRASSAVIAAARLVPSSRGRVRVTVTDGFLGASGDSGRLRVAGRAPTVFVDGGTGRRTMRADGVRTLSAIAFADDRRPVAASAMRWSAGATRLGTGATVRVSGLRAGRRTVVLSATDRRGRRARVSIPVTVAAATPSFTVLAAPARVARTARSVVVSVSATAAGTLRIAGALRSRPIALTTAPRRLTIAIRPGPRPLTLTFRLVAGRRVTVRAVTIARP